MLCSVYVYGAAIAGLVPNIERIIIIFYFVIVIPFTNNIYSSAKVCCLPADDVILDIF